VRYFDDNEFCFKLKNDLSEKGKLIMLNLEKMSRDGKINTIED
jgi:hypothetical protein